MPTMRELLKALVGVPITIGGVTYPNGYADDLGIDRTNLEEEFVQHSERYAYYATLFEMADDRADRLKEELELTAANLDHEKREKAKAIQLQDPKFKMTETMFENEVKMDKRYQAKQQEYADARHLSKLLKAAPMAFAHRRDMLLELARSSMAQMNDPRITQQRQEQARQALALKQRMTQHTAPALPEPTPEPQEMSTPGSDHVPAPQNPTPSRRRPARQV
jgi:hypothetical protein